MKYILMAMLLIAFALSGCSQVSDPVLEQSHSPPILEEVPQNPIIQYDSIMEESADATQECSVAPDIIRPIVLPSQNTAKEDHPMESETPVTDSPIDEETTESYADPEVILPEEPITEEGPPPVDPVPVDPVPVDPVPVDPAPVPQSPAHEHLWSEWTVIEDATFTAEGIQERSCINCSETESQAVPKEILDAASIAAYGNSYAASLGFILDASVASGNAGYYPALDYCVNTMSECYSYVAAQVYNTYSRLMNAHGTIEGARYYCTVEYLGSDAYGTYILISDYYG